MPDGQAEGEKKREFASLWIARHEVLINKGPLQLKSVWENKVPSCVVF